jgi:hypothetical protein
MHYCQNIVFYCRHARVGLLEGPAIACREPTVVHLLQCTSRHKYVQDRGGIASRIFTQDRTVLGVTVLIPGRLIFYPAQKPVMSLG